MASLLLLLDRVRRLVCAAVGHANDVHDTGLVRVAVCLNCRRQTVEVYGCAAARVWLVGEYDGLGRLTRAPRTVLVQEVRVGPVP